MLPSTDLTTPTCETSVTPIFILLLCMNRDRLPEVDDVEGLAAAATKHLELLKQKDEAEI